MSRRVEIVLPDRVLRVEDPDVAAVVAEQKAEIERLQRRLDFATAVAIEWTELYVKSAFRSTMVFAGEEMLHVLRTGRRKP